MKLSSFIRTDLESILQEWEDFARTIYSAAFEKDAVVLRDHAQAMLEVIATDLDTPQTAQQSVEKSKGNKTHKKVETAAETHAAARLAAGFSIEQLIAEYRALRSSVLRLWKQNNSGSNIAGVEDVIRFNDAIDQALTESVTRFSLMIRQSQNVFLAILSHDVRTPIGAIGMSSQVLLRDENLPAKFLKTATRIQNSAKRVDEIVCDLLDFATTHTGEALPVVLERGDVAVLSENVVEEARAFHPDRAIELDIAGSTDTRVDSARISQAFSNLISNALQYGSANTVVLVTVIGTSDEVVWSVHNLGAPISAADIKLIFDPVKRYALRPATERSRQQKTNLGLGLHIARQIVDAHGGKIAVTSSPDDGTTFTITLPKMK